MTTECFLAARGVKKRYGAVVALANADVEIRGGEVMGLLGQNGAGKQHPDQDSVRAPPRRCR